MNDKVLKYIKENISKTICSSNEKKGLIKPYSVPTIGDMFHSFFYWDTYFINICLLELGLNDQAKNNLLNIKNLINIYGFMPNADVLTDRSQPPLFALAVYDYYLYEKKDEVIREFLPSILKEYDFWMTCRVTSTGLNRYGCSNFSTLKKFNKEIQLRLNLNDSNYGEHLMAIAESGWDFTPRFGDGKNMFACANFCPIDLNSFIYKIEIIIAEFYEILGDKTKEKVFKEKAVLRKNLINKLMLNKERIYLDYNYSTDNLSNVISSASFCPYYASLSNDKIGVQNLFKYLKFNNGLSTANYRKTKKYFQWDYPMMWAPLVFFAIKACENCYMKEEEIVLETLFVNIVEKEFDRTGQLWEKYNCLTGKKGEDVEYQTPPMLGWTAGVYLYCLKKVTTETTITLTS